MGGVYDWGVKTAISTIFGGVIAYLALNIAVPPMIALMKIEDDTLVALLETAAPLIGAVIVILIILRIAR
jgi:Ca2+/Na+ antiporter